MYFTLIDFVCSFVCFQMNKRLGIKEMHSRFIDTLKSECTDWEQALKDHPKIRDYLDKWENWMEESKHYRYIAVLPFTEDDYNYLDSPLLDELRKYPKGDVEYVFEKSRNVITLEWLLSNFPEIERRTYLPSVFKNLCVEGYLESAKWLYSHVVKGKNNLGYVLYVTFENTCGKGHLEVAQWLYQTFNIPHFRSAYDRAQENGQRKVVEWLKSLGVSERADFGPPYWVLHARANSGKLRF